MTLKSIKMYAWTSKCLLGDPLDPWITKMVTQGTQNRASSLPKCQFWVGKVTHFSSQPVNSCLLTGGLAAGAKP